MSHSKASYRLDNSLFKLILSQAKEYRYYYLAATISLVVTHYIQSHLPFMAKELGEKAGFDKLHEVKLWPFIGAALGILLFRSASRILFFYPARVLQRDLRVELVGRLEKTHPERLKDYSSGQLFQVMQNDLNQIRALFGFAFLQIANIFMAFIVLLPKMASFHSRLLWAFTPMFITMLIFTFVIYKVWPLYRKVQDYQGEVQNFLIESYQGKKTIRNYNSEKSFLDLFFQLSKKELDTFYRAFVVTSLSRPLIMFGMGLSLLLGAYMIKKDGLSASSLILFSGFVFLLREPITNISWMGTIYSSSIGSWNRIKELLEATKKIGPWEKIIEEYNNIGPINSSKLNQKLDFITPFWEHKIKFSFERGKFYCFVSPTGHGKSGLLEKLATFAKLKGLKVAYLAQGPYLFNDTIENNLILNQNIEQKDIEFWPEVFQLEHISNENDNFFDLEIGENGKKISGGQAKRLAIIRTLIADADLIIWDDPFSSVDILLEKNIFKAIKENINFANKFIVMSSHRLSTVKSSDYIYFINKLDGVIESGPPTKILREGYQLYEYFKKQMV